MRIVSKHYVVIASIFSLEDCEVKCAPPIVLGGKPNFPFELLDQPLANGEAQAHPSRVCPLRFGALLPRKHFKHACFVGFLDAKPRVYYFKFDCIGCGA